MGNLDSMRDWGHAKDYVLMQWMMLQQKVAEDYVIATGRKETVRKFIELTAKELGWGDNKNNAIIWEGKGVNEIGLRGDTKEVVVRVDSRYFRPTEVDQLLGNPQKAFKKLGWVPKTTLEELVKEMVKSDKDEAQKELILIKKGFETDQKSK